MIFFRSYWTPRGPNQGDDDRHRLRRNDSGFSALLRGEQDRKEIGMTIRTATSALAALGLAAFALGATAVSANAMPPGPPQCWARQHHHWIWVCPHSQYRSEYYRPGLGIYLNFDTNNHDHHDHDHDHMDMKLKP
jgi:hypothetical protein